MKQVIVDFETASACDLKKAGAWRYAEDITTEIICLGYIVEGREPVVWKPGDDETELRALAADPDALFIAHNAQFEKAIWRRVLVDIHGWPDIPNSRWHDIMAVCAMKVIPQKLEHAAVVLRLPHEKDTEGSRITKGLSKPKKGYYDRSPAILERVYAYNLQDLRTEAAAHERLGWLSPGERSVWLLDQRINERGVRLDLEFVRRAQSVVQRATVPLAAEFKEITGGLEFSQRDKVIEWVRGQGVAIPNMQKATLDAMLGADEESEDDNDTSDTPELPPSVHRALAIRRLVASASIKKLDRMVACCGADGRARGLIQYHGAGTGRFSGRLLQPQNFPRGTVKGDIDARVNAIMSGDPRVVEEATGKPALEVVISSLRHAIIAADGRRLTAGDFAGIEARVVLALAGQHDKTALMAAGADVYCDMAQEIYGYPVNKNDHPEERQTGKNSVLGLGFQMGWQKFKARYAKDQPDEFAQRVVTTYREDWAPLVPELWYGLEEAALKTVWDRVPHEAYGVRYALEDGWLTARLPSGRKLWYFNPQPTKKAMPWDHTDVRRAWTYQALKMGQWKTIDAYGGLLTENVVQALARDIMVTAMFKCEREALPICLTVHDEIVTEPEAKNADKDKLQQIMADIPDWARAIQVPIAAETWTGSRYKK